MKRYGKLGPRKIYFLKKILQNTFDPEKFSRTKMDSKTRDWFDTRSSVDQFMLLKPEFSDNPFFVRKYIMANPTNLFYRECWYELTGEGAQYILGHKRNIDSFTEKEIQLLVRLACISSL